MTIIKSIFKNNTLGNNISCKSLLQNFYFYFYFCYVNKGGLFKAGRSNCGFIVIHFIEGTKVNTYRVFDSARTVNKMFCPENGKSTESLEELICCYCRMESLGLLLWSVQECNNKSSL